MSGDIGQGTAHAAIDFAGSLLSDSNGQQVISNFDFIGYVLRIHVCMYVCIILIYRISIIK